MIKTTKTILPYAICFLAFLIIYSCDSGSSVTKTIVEDPYNGIRRKYRDNGTLLAEVTYRDSIRDGIARNFYPNGNLQLEMTYVKGIKHGDAITFYEKGGVYQITPFVNGGRNGIQKKFYDNGALMAEVPFEKNAQVPGMKEYSKEGKLLSKDVKIVFSLEDKTAFENKFNLVISLSDGSTHAKFSQLFDGPNTLLELPLETKNGKAVTEFFVPPGTSLMERVTIQAQRKTRLGNIEIFRGSYNLAVENKKRFFD
jgi:antitoxin component YwqK of YwqJK toxin-antitoxin module